MRSPCSSNTDSAAEVRGRRGLQHLISCLVAAAAAVGLAGVGVVRGTYAAGGSDSSCYALMADSFASGDLQPTSALAAVVPWPDAPATFTPGGFIPSESNPSASAPVCAPGFSVLLAPFVALGGRDALFWATPLAAVLLIWMTFVAGRALAGSVAGAMAAVLVSVSPPVLYQVVQPMNDIATAALWMAVFVSLIQRRWAIAGACCGLALLVRPNLLPLAAVAGVFVLASQPSPNPQSPIPNSQSLIPRALRFSVAVVPFGLAILLLNNLLYGSPFRSGYGGLDSLFAASNVHVNAPRYLGWMLETHTVFPFLGFIAPFAVERQKRSDALLACGLIAATASIYFIYTPFDDWSYLRFLLPAITLMLVLASVATVRILGRTLSGFRLRVVENVAIAAITTGLALAYVGAAAERHAFVLKYLEQRYRSAGLVVRDRLPDKAVVLSMWDSGAVRFHGRKEALTWQGLDPAWLDRGLAWLESRGHRPYIMVESWEEQGFRERFSNHSDAGKLDWPPRYEIDRLVRIYDPQDRPRHQRREKVDTEFLWPIREQEGSRK